MKRALKQRWLRRTLQNLPHTPPLLCFIGQWTEIGFFYQIEDGARVYEVHLDVARPMLPDHNVAGQPQPQQVDPQITLTAFDPFTRVISLDRIECC